MSNKTWEEALIFLTAVIAIFMAGYSAGYLVGHKAGKIQAPAYMYDAGRINDLNTACKILGCE